MYFISDVKNEVSKLKNERNENIKKLNCEIIDDNFFTVTNDLIRHDVIKLGLRIFSYLLGV